MNVCRGNEQQEGQEEQSTDRKREGLIFWLSSIEGRKLLTVEHLCGWKTLAEVFNS